MATLFLDDDDERHDIFDQWWAGTVVHAHTINEFRDAIHSRKFSTIWLDHDLNNYKYKSLNVDLHRQNGTDAAYLICRLKPVFRPHRVYLHTINPDGAKDMAVVLRREGIRVTRMSFNNIYYTYEQRRIGNDII